MRIDADTGLYAVFGNPVRHSKSPLIHNACFEHYGRNAVYLAFEIDDICEGIKSMRELPIKGASITIPFKSDVRAYLDEIDTDAQTIGAVNTIVNRAGKLVGYNTDSMAAISPLKPLGIKDKNVCILGAGGAARAVAHGIQKENGRVIIANRNPARGEHLAEDVNGIFVQLTDETVFRQLDIDILINTTPVGMVPETDSLPVPVARLNPRMIVMDIIYTPLQTRLLKEARKIGCRTINGLMMFIYQAAAQFELWTGIQPDLNIMNAALQDGDR